MAESSLTVNFTTFAASGEGGMTVELDEDANKANNAGRTSNFLFGDTVYYKVFCNPTNMNLTTYLSDGTNNDLGTAIETGREETLTFAEPPISLGGKVEDNTASLQVPADSGFLATQISSTGCGTISLNADDKTLAEASQTGVGIYDCVYNAEYNSFTLSGVAQPAGWIPTEEKPNFPVIVLIIGEII